MISPPQQKLIDAALKAGIQVEDLSTAWSQDAVRFTFAGQEHIVFEGNSIGSNSVLGVTICHDLPIARHYLSHLEIPHPRGKVFKLHDTQTSREELLALLGDFWQEGNRYTCQPAFANEGHGHASNLKSIAELEIHLDTFADDYATWMLDEQIDGEDLQLLVINGSLEIGILRSALRLEGDGDRTLEELIEAYNARVSPEQAVVIDGETRQLLRDQSVYLSEKVPAGQSVQVKNPGAGAGSAKDITMALHPKYGEWCAKLAVSVKLKVFSISIRTSAHTQDPTRNAWVMGLNAKPEWQAFEQAEGNEKNVAALILKSMFTVA